MSKTLYEQIACKCLHFNGVMNKSCNIGINYADVRVDKPYKFPCLQQGGECAKAEFPTEEQITKKLQAIEDSGLKAIRAIADIKEHVEKVKIKAGQIKCRCGGDLNYVVANINGDIWANCRSCGLSFNE
jgi:hypothetical protein